jgi:hypothetical protein
MMETFSRGIVYLIPKMFTGVRPDVAFALTVRSRRGVHDAVFRFVRFPIPGIQYPTGS